MTSRRRLACILSLAVLAASCSLPTDDEAALIDTDTLPEVLQSETQATTTTEPGPRATVEIYLLRNDGDRTVVQAVTRDIDPFVDVEQEIGLLFRGAAVPDIRTEEEAENGWFSALSDFRLTEAFVNENQVAIIDMIAVDENGEPVEVPAEGLRDAIAQLVYTATGLPDAEPILAVRILIDGERRTLPTDGEDSDDVLNRADFETYDPEFVPPTTTTEEPVETTTTVEAEPVEGDADG